MIEYPDKSKVLNGCCLIERVDNRSRYEGLRALWCRVFGDPPEYVDSFFRAFGSDPEAAWPGAACGGKALYADGIGGISGFVMTDDRGRVCSALTCVRCGKLETGKPVFMSYAICTDPEMRGRGLAGELTVHARDMALAEGGISILSPAEESLTGFYRRLGYSERFMAEEISLEEDEDHEYEYPVRIEEADIGTYNKYREEFLAGRDHVILSSEILDCVRKDLGSGGLLIINGGDAICAAYGPGEGTDREMLTLAELIVNPCLEALSSEIDEAIALSVSCGMGYKGVSYRKPASPGRGYCQTMAAGMPESLGLPGYYGFPMD